MPCDGYHLNPMPPANPHVPSASRRTRILSPPQSSRLLQPRKARTLQVSKDVSAKKTTRTLEDGELRQSIVTTETSRVSITDQLGEATEDKPRQKRWGASSTSSSTTHPEGPEPARGRQRERTLAARKKRRLKKYLGRAFDADARGTTFLEDQAVTAQVQRCYGKEVNELLRSVAQQNLAFKEDRDIDAGIVKFMNRCFWLGEQAHKGEKLLAAFMHKRPDFGRLGSCKLPRSWQALKGWRMLTPARSRRPWPLAVWAAVAVAVPQAARADCRLHHGRLEFVHPPCGAFAKHHLFFGAPSAACNSRADAFAVPGKPGATCGKTGELRPWSHTVVALPKKQPDNTPLWDFNYGDYVAEFRKACQTPYQMRHSGPSMDRATGGQLWRYKREEAGRARKASCATRSQQDSGQPFSSCPFDSGSTASGAKSISGMLSSAERLLWHRLEEAPAATFWNSFRARAG